MDRSAVVAWQYAARLIHPEDLPMAAAQLLAEGYDSASLRDLAGRSRNADTSEIDGLFEEAMRELGSRIPDQGTTERCLLHHLAAQLCAGSVSPRYVAARVWHGMASPTEPEQAFVQVVAEEYYLDQLSPADFRAWESAVRVAAETLARTGFPLVP